MRTFFVTGGIAAMAILTLASAFGIGERIADRAPIAAPAPGVPRGNAPIQRVTLGYDGRNYSPSTIRVRRGAPVEITANLATLRGCFRALVIPDFNVWTQFSSGRPSVTFTPDRAGTFRFSCAMGMGVGQLIVEG